LGPYGCRYGKGKDDPLGTGPFVKDRRFWKMKNKPRNIPEVLESFLKLNKESFRFDFPADIPQKDREQLTLRSVQAWAVKTVKEKLGSELSDAEISYIEEMVASFLRTQK
jgi:hypothetical protein